MTGRATQTHKTSKTLLTKHPDRSHKIRQPTRQDKDTDHGAIAEDEKGDQKGLKTASVNVAGYLIIGSSISPGGIVGDGDLVGDAT